MARIVRFSEIGGPEVLQVEDVAVPPPAADEVQIRVKAVGVNRAESLFRRGQYLEFPQFPARLGYEAAGLVESLGNGVQDLAPGDAVSVIPPLSITRWGTYGELANVPAAVVVKHPAALSWTEAAATWMPLLTAYSGLIDIAQTGKDDFVVVTAASSSVGLAAIQIANRVGALPIATTRSSAKQEALVAAGARHVIATEEEDLATRIKEITNGSGARVVFDPVGGPMVESLTDALAPGGILIAYGVLSTAPTPLPMVHLLGKGLTIRGLIYKDVVADPARRGRFKRFALDGLASGALKPMIAKTFPLDAIVEAHRYLESNAQIGKVVVTV